MPTHSTLNPDVLSPFEVTLARGLNMTRNRQTASPEYKRRFLSLTLRGRKPLRRRFRESTIYTAPVSATMRGR